MAGAGIATRRAGRFCRWAFAVLQVACITAGVACDASSSSPPRPRVRITTGIPGSGFYPLGRAIARAYAASSPPIDVEVTQDATTLSNLEAIQRGDAEIGLAFADVTYMAFQGELESNRAPFDHLRGMALLQLTPIHLLVRGGSDINTPLQLRGRHVNLGPEGSNTALTATIVLKSYGIDVKALRSERLLFNAAVPELIKGSLDAMFVNGNYPADAVRVATKADARLLPIVGPAVRQLRQDYPFFQLTVIPRGTYPGQERAVHTIGVYSLLLCRDALDENLVHDLTKRLFDVLPLLALEQGSLRSVDLGFASTTPIPLHPGAARYYRERTLLR